MSREGIIVNSLRNDKEYLCAYLLQTSRPSVTRTDGSSYFSVRTDNCILYVLLSDEWNDLNSASCLRDLSLLNYLATSDALCNESIRPLEVTWNAFGLHDDVEMDFTVALKKFALLRLRRVGNCYGAKIDQIITLAGNYFQNFRENTDFLRRSYLYAFNLK